jgi:hypothetical protein
LEILSDVAKIVDEEIEARLREESTWPPVTDCDRLHKTFGDLHKNDILPFGLYDIAQELGYEGLLEVLESWPGKPCRRGYVLYDVRATRAAMHGYGLGLIFGKIGGSDDEIAAVGTEVVETLARNGLETEWDGDPNHTIIVKMDWKLRLADAMDADASPSDPGELIHLAE